MLALRAAVIALCVACGADRPFDPADGVPYREFPDVATAVRALVDEQERAPRVFAVGEYHPTVGVPVRTPLAWFSAEVLPVLEARASHLVVETWRDASCTAADPVQAQVVRVTQRPPSQPGEIAHLATTKVETHGLSMTCLEHSAMLDPKGRVDFFRLLEMVTVKLHEAARRLLRDGQDVIVYGGALHNDRYPRWPLDTLAYAHTLARDYEVLELDLAVPEIVAPIRLLWTEDWFPLVARAAPDRVLVWQRGPGSYVLILPASQAVARADVVM